MAANGDDSDDAGEDGDDKRIRKAFQSASASAFFLGSTAGRAATCMMARAKATYVPNHVSRQASSSRAGSAFSVQVVHLVSPPPEVRHVIPEYFMLCDSGATHHMLSDMMFFAHLRDKYLQVSWGDSSPSRSLGIGHLIFLGYLSSARSGRAAPKPCILTSGTDDALLIPDCTRSLCSLTCFSAQGHTVHLNESNPGIVLRDGKGFIPCCLESETGYVLLPCFPPPSSATFVRTRCEMPVIDLDASLTSGTYVSALDATTFCAAAADSFSSASSSADASSSSSDSASATNSSSFDSSDSSDDTPTPVIKGGKSPVDAVSKKKKKSSSAGMPSQKKSKSSKQSVQATGWTKKCKSFKPVNSVVHGIDSTNSLRRALVKAHERYGHVSPMKLVYFKKKGRVHSWIIPMRGALDVKIKDCQICAVMKNKRPKKPTAVLIEEKRQ